MSTNTVVLPAELWPHQKASVAKAMERDDKGEFVRTYHGLFHEQGTGKTLTMITLLRNIYTHYRRPVRTIIFCPVVVVENWKREIERWSRCGQFVVLLNKSGKKRKEALDNAPEGAIFITNYESLDMEGLFWEYRGKKSKVKVPRALGVGCIVLDESHRIKNPSSERTKTLLKMSTFCKHRYILSGTPVTNSPFDIWSQMKFLDRGKRLGEKFYGFKQKYFIDKNAGMPGQKHFPLWDYREGAEAGIQKTIADVADRVLKEECLDLPPLLMQSVEVEMAGDQLKAYREMERDFIAYVHSFEEGELKATVAVNALTKVLRLLQISSGFIKDEEEEITHFRSNPKLEGLKDLLTDYTLAGEKVILWATFAPNYKQIAALCKKMGLSHGFLIGEQSQKQKQDSVDSFTQGNTQVLIANPAAGGTGVNLVEARTAIWFSRTYSLEQRLQALARNHRGGAEIHESVLSIDIVARGSIDELVLNKLGQKKSIADNLLELAQNLQNRS